MKNLSLYNIENEPKQPTLKTSKGFWPGRFSIKLLLSDYDQILGSAIVSLSHYVPQNQVKKSLLQIGLSPKKNQLEDFGTSSSLRYGFLFDEIQLIRQYFSNDENIKIYGITAAKININDRDCWLSKNTIAYPELSTMLGGPVIGQVIAYLTCDNHEIESSTGNEYQILELRREIERLENQKIF